MNYGQFDFHAVFDHETRLPEFKGSMIRGALGHALKQTVCAVRKKECAQCLLRSNCIYARVFEVKTNPDSNSRHVHLPHPYVLNFKDDQQQHFDAGGSFQITLLLFGTMIEAFPYFVYAFERMGEQGVGKKDEQGQRNTFSLKSIRCQDQTIYSAEHPELPSILPQRTLQWTVLEHPVQRIRLTLETPLRVKNKGAFVRELSFLILLRTLIRRIQMLWNAFSSETPPFEEQELLQQAHEVHIAENSLFWKKQLRYSSRQNNLQRMDGLQGSIVFSGRLTPFIPLLQMAQVLHLGKETSFGLGKINIQILE